MSKRVVRQMNVLFLIFLMGILPASSQGLEVNPRVTLVHIDQADVNTQFYFLAAVPMAVFHHGGDVYSSLLISDDIGDQTVGYMIDDWQAYLDQHSSEKRHANFIGGVSTATQNAIRTQFGIDSDQDVSIIEGTPIQVANQIAEKDWKFSDYVVIAPYKASLTNHDVETISNGAVLAALYNAPLLFAYTDSLSALTLVTMSRLGVNQAILVEIDDVLSANVESQLAGIGVTVVADLTSETDVVTAIRSVAGHSTLCGIVNNWQNLPAAFSGARYGGYVLYLPGGLNKMANGLAEKIKADPELSSRYKLEEPLVGKDWLKLTEEQIAQNFYNWLGTVGGNDPNALETVITFEPQGTGGGDLETTFERAISGDPSDLTRPGAISGRMPLPFKRNLAVANRTGMYRATIFANPRPTHVTMAMNAYEVRHTPNTGSPVPDSWGSNHIVNEIFGWPEAGWTASNGYFPWDDIHTNPPDLYPILPPPANGSAGHDAGQFTAFLDAGYEGHFHSGARAGSGNHPAQPDVDNIGFVQDAMVDGACFLYFSCHGGGTVLSVRVTDNGIATDDNPPWGDTYWPDDDERVYDGSAGGDYYQSDLENDLTNAHGLMVAYNACGMAEGYMNEILLEHGGTVSIGSYVSVSFTGSGWWWNIWCQLVTHEGYTAGEATTYSNARVSYVHTPGSKAPDETLKYVLYGDPNTPFVQTDWSSPEPASINVLYGGHKPDKPAQEFAGSLSPDTITVNVPTQVTVTLLDSAGLGVDSVVVTVKGWGVSLEDVTDPSGQVIFTVTAPYGEELMVFGEKEAFDTFRDTIHVIGALDFVSPDISASVEVVGLYDALTPFYEGTIVGVCHQAGFTLYALGCGVDTSTVAGGDSVDLVVVPTSTGTVKSVIAKSGYNIYLENIPVIPIFGTLSGTVTDSSTGISLDGVTVVGYEGGADTSAALPVFQVVTAAGGVYTVPDELEVGPYDIYVHRFGYLPFDGTAMVLYGANVYDIALVPAPSGDVSGQVKEEGTLRPLTATIRIYRYDDLALQTTVYTDSLAGGTYSVNLPYFTYIFKVSSYQHVPMTRQVVVDEPTEIQDFKMEPTVGNILVINDDVGSTMDNCPSEVLEKTKKEASNLGSKAGESAQAMASMLTYLGYYVISEQANQIDPGTWENYDLIVWSDGDYTTPVSVESYRTALESHVAGGGKLLIEGGELGYDALSYPGYPTFAQNVLHSIDWDSDSPGGLRKAEASHPVASFPNVLPTTIAINHVGYGDEDANVPASDALVVFDCSSFAGDAGVLVYDNTPAPESGQIVFYSFNFAAVSDTLIARELLENTVHYLLAQETEPTAAMSGFVNVRGEDDNSGAEVTARLGGFVKSATTLYDGSYLIEGLYAGSYEVTAGKGGYQDSTVSGVVVEEGQETQNVNLSIFPIVVLYSWDFDSGPGDFQVSGIWQTGFPSSGPGSAHSLPNVWGTVLAGEYPSSNNSMLTTPVLLMAKGASKPTLRFWHWYDTEGYYDGGNVKVSVNGGLWTIIDPEVPYPEDQASSSNVGIPEERCYSGHNQRCWEKVVFPLSSVVQEEENFLVRWHFGSDGSVTDDGWYIDDVQIVYVDYTVSVDDERLDVALPKRHDLSQNYPNPFNPVTEIPYALPAESGVKLEVFNVLGQRITTLVEGTQPAGYHRARWDGRDERGQDVSSGIYFYRLEAGEYLAVRQMVLVR